MSRSGQTQVFYRGCRFGLAPGTAAFWRVAGGLRNDRDGFPIRLSLVELESWHVEVVPVVRLVAHDHAPLGEPTDGTFHHFQAHIPALRVELGPQPGRVILRSPFAVEGDWHDGPGEPGKIVRHVVDIFAVHEFSVE